ncbi:MAG: efflux RND transporter permease subunit, partial [Bacteroidales bacterium]|nr:efflux RND transporter permease subunit [Bacteroidales bacterium]
LIYLILACLYNSLFIPLAVLLSIPFGMFGAYFVMRPLAALGININIYVQTGVIMLMGLVAKTAILITEFAMQKREEGLSPYDAAIGACKDRLRPILMTVLTMIIGMIPLIVEGGAGAIGNKSLAICVVGGMIVGTIAILFITPALYIVFQKIHERLTPDQPDVIEE